MFDQKEYNKESYQWFKAHGICVHCHKEKAEPGETKCLACKMEARERSREYKRKNRVSPDQSKKCTEAMRRLKAERREKGLCIECGKPVYPGKSMCIRCLTRKKNYDAERHAKTRKHYREDGLCVRCGAERMEGRTVCADCYKKLCEQIAFGREVAQKNKTAHPWNDYWKLWAAQQASGMPQLKGAVQ